MTAPLSQLLENILQGQISNAPTPKKKGFLSFLSKEEKPDLSQYIRALYNTLSSSRSGGHNAAEVVQLIKSVLNPPNIIFQHSIENDYREFYRRSKSFASSSYYFDRYIEVLVSDGWLSGEKRLIFRFFPFLLGYLEEAQKLSTHNLFNNIPVDNHKEAFILCLMGCLKKTNSYDPIIFAIRSMLLHLTLSPEEKSWVFRYIEDHGEVNFNGHLEKLMSLLFQLIEEYETAKNTLERPEFYKLKLKDLQAFQAFESLNNQQLLELSKLLTIIQSFHENYFHNFKSKIHEITLLAETKMSGSEEYILQQMQLVLKSGGKFAMADSVSHFIKNIKKGSQISDALYEAVWDYHFRFPHWKVAQNLGKAIRQQTTFRLEKSGLPITWEALLWSGFKQVPIPMHHSPYHGLHPDQVRPYFQLIRAVADIDIIKIYKVQKTYRVRFIFKGETFDISTGDGFGTGCMNDLNTLLFEKGVPYQLVVLTATFFEASNQSYHPKIITLVNEATYQQFKQNIVSQNLAGFAKSDEPAPIFLKNIADLGRMKARPDLDNINLAEDPKFSVIREQLNKLQPLEVWTKLLLHCLKFPINSKPGKTWQKEANALVDSMEVDQFRAGLALVVDNIIKGDEWFSDDEKICGLRGLTWLCRLHTNPNLLYLSQRIATKAYKKVTGGALNAKLGNIALAGLVQVGTLQAYGALGNLKAKAKYSVFLRAIASAMKKFTGLLKQYPASELEDRVIPSHEMEQGKKSIPIGSYHALLHLEGMKVKMKWQNEKGKITASSPAAIRRDFAGELKVVRAEAKSIEETLKAQATRLEKSWLEQRSWAFPFWKEFYQSHPLMGVLVEKLIWIAATNEHSVSFMSKDGQFFNANNEEIELAEASTIRLWHPALAASAQEVEAWRNLLFDKKIVQPFKQAFREVYLLTPAEEATYDQSFRFAGHHLRGNTLYSLGKNRGWNMTYDQPPLLKIPAANLIAELGISGGVLYSECNTQGLYFKSTEGTTSSAIHRQPQLPLAEIPPEILSEVMRDIDLFVAVSGIGIDPYFNQNHSGELLAYWKNVSFGKKSRTSIAEIRKDLLGRLLPMTKIAGKCKLEGNFLEVEGNIRSYKINLNSGNILMLPNDQYLCIVQKSNPRLEKQIWLPFEGGDQTLMVILSKAFLLAEDDKIEDPSIMMQIKGRK